MTVILVENTRKAFALVEARYAARGWTMDETTASTSSR
jgi:hypothetical protein